MQHYTITIDGTSGVGKSTLTKKLSSLYAIPYLDTGSMFRSLAYMFMQKYQGEGHTIITPSIVKEIIEESSFELLYIDGSTQLLYNKQPLSPLIRTEEVARIASHLAPIKEIREALKSKQYELAKISSLIAEGRDMGTIVFPNATCKFFLTAKAEERAKRRYLELEKSGQHTEYNIILSQIKERDVLDTTRALSPLIPAKDSHSIDTTEYTEAELLQYVQHILSIHGIFPQENIQKN